MNPTPYTRPGLPATGRLDPPQLISRWLAELRTAPEAPRAVALAGFVARADPGLVHGIDGDPPADQVRAALAAGDPVGWRVRFLQVVEECGDPAPAIDELDALELAWAFAERAGAAPAGLRATLDGCVALLVAYAPELVVATEYVQSVAATFRPDLADQDPVLARTAEKFVALLGAAEVVARDEERLPGLRAPDAESAAPVPARHGRVPPLPAGFPLAAGATVELPAVAPYEWHNVQKGKKGHVAILQVPQVPSPDRALKLIVHPAAEYANKPVLLGGLRGVVDIDGVAVFDWDDVVAVGELIEHLVLGSGATWKTYSTGDRDE